MSPRKVLTAIVLTSALLALASALVPQTVYATCGLPGTPPCSTGGDKKKVPTRTPLPTNTAIAILPILPVMPLSGGGAEGSPTPTFDPGLLTAIAQTQTASALPRMSTPSATPTSGASGRPIVTPVAGPVLVLPGTAVMIIIVAFIVLLLAGGVLLARRVDRAGPQRPPNSNKET